MKKENKSISVSGNKMIVTYHDTAKHFIYRLDEKGVTKDIKLFGKSFKGVKASEIKKDFFTKEQRELFDDLVYARHKMSQKEIDALPIVKKYRIKVLSKEVERVLTQWKAEIVTKKVDSLLLKLFPNSPFVKEFVNVQCEQRDKIYCDSINIHSVLSEMEIAEYLSSKGLFPKLR